MNTQSGAPGASDDLLARLAEAAGEGEAVITGDAATAYYTDVYRRLQTPLAVVRPATIDALIAVVKAAAPAGLALFPRGGGASYTDGYLPNRPDSLIIDTGRLNRIVEINEADAYVTVEAGVTWAQLKAALDPLGLRTPFFGPFSGLAATIGGAMSQNAISHGSGPHGISAESALAMEIVTIDGEVIRTGSSSRGVGPHTRHYGPDLTGLFTGDCGALGIKTVISLPLLRRMPAFGSASFAFGTLADMAGAMRRAAMERLDAESFAIDAALSQGQIARQDRAGALFDMARSVMASATSPITGLVQLAKMALAGSHALKNSAFMLHVIFEGVNDSEVRAKMARYRKLMTPGWEIPNTVPAIVRGMPFAPLYNTLGPQGERWAAIHGVMPYSKAAAFHDALQAFYVERAEEMKRLGVWTGGMFSAVRSSSLLYEIALYWPGAQTAYHRAAVPADYLAALPVYPDDDEVTAYVAQLKTDLIALYRRFDATHFQLGKAYPYASILEPGALGLLKALKAALDPKGLMNPGALEL